MQRIVSTEMPNILGCSMCVNIKYSVSSTVDGMTLQMIYSRFILFLMFFTLSTVTEDISNSHHGIHFYKASFFFLFSFLSPHLTQFFFCYGISTLIHNTQTLILSLQKETCFVLGSLLSSNTPPGLNSSVVVVISEFQPFMFVRYEVNVVQSECTHWSVIIRALIILFGM